MLFFLFPTHLNNCWHFWTALNLGDFPKQSFLCGFVFRGLKPSRDVVRYTCRQRAEKEIGEWSLVSQYFVIVRITQNEYEQDKNAVYNWTQAKCCTRAQTSWILLLNFCLTKGLVLTVPCVGHVKPLGNSWGIQCFCCIQYLQVYVILCFILQWNTSPCEN